jgi:hypothetical protein
MREFREEGIVKLDNERRENMLRKNIDGSAVALGKHKMESR